MMVHRMDGLHAHTTQMSKLRQVPVAHTTKSPLRGILVNFWREMMEARAGVEPTYTDLQSGA